MGVQIGEQGFTATSGNYVLKPQGIPHTFWNAGAQPARTVENISPAGFKKHFDEIGEVGWAAAGGEPNFAKLTEIADRYGLTMYMERVPALLEKYNLRLG